MSKEEAKVEFVPAKTYEERMATLAKGDGKVVRIPREVSRKEVVGTFQECFEMVGGVNRLAMWADENPTDFYRLYAKLLPSQSSTALGESNELVIKHVLPRGKLDEEV